MVSKKDYIDVSEFSLQDWLELVFDPPPDKFFLNVCFPSDKLSQEYIESVNDRSDAEVTMLLLHFLIRSGTIEPFDQFHLRALIATQRSDSDMYERMLSHQYFRRLVRFASGDTSVQPWEGITWILDLLPHFPKIALEALHAYILAHAQELPDRRLDGLYDAAEIIRAKYIGVPGSKQETIQFLFNLQPREFECLVERLYDAMEYATELTPARKDGGRDVKANKTKPGQLERLLIECKRHHGTVGVGIVRHLLGVVAHEKANKGVLIATSSFSAAAQEFARPNLIELINGQELALLLNEHLGPKWPLHMDRLMAESERKAANQQIPNRPSPTKARKGEHCEVSSSMLTCNSEQD